jgi:hypothetical protein
LKQNCIHSGNKKEVMDEEGEIEEFKAQEARRVREEAKKCLRHASIQLCKAAYEIDQYLNEFSTARIPIRRQVILNEAIAHLVVNVLPNLGIAEMASLQVQLAMRDHVKQLIYSDGDATGNI